MQPHLLFLSTVLILMRNHTASHWMQGSTLPQVDKSQAIGYYNDSLWIFGGACNRYSLIQYHIPTNTILYNNTQALDDAMIGDAQFYTQLNNKLYFRYYVTLSYYDLSTLTPINTLPIAAIDINSNNNIHNLNGKGCLASFAINQYEYIYITGGGVTATDEFWSYSILSDTWHFGPAMNIPRKYSACIIHSQSKELYVIGGQLPNDNKLSSIEKISVMNLSLSNNTSWNIIGNTSFPISGGRAVVYHNYVLITSGYSSIVSRFDVFVINVDTDSVYALDFVEMNPGVEEAATAIVDDVIYVFGGQWKSGNCDSGAYSSVSQYLNLSELLNVTVPTSNTTLIPVIFTNATYTTHSAYSTKSVYTTNKWYTSTTRSRNIYDGMSWIIITVTLIGAITCIVITTVFACICKQSKRNDVNSSVIQEQKQAEHIEMCHDRVGEMNNEINDEMEGVMEGQLFAEDSMDRENSDMYDNKPKRTNDTIKTIGGNDGDV